MKLKIVCIILLLAILICSVSCNQKNDNNGNDGKSGYEIAVENGFKGSMKDWIESLEAENRTDTEESAETKFGTDAETETEQSSKEPILTATADKLNDGEYLNSLSNIDVRKNDTQTFFAKILSFNGVQIGHGEAEFGGSYVIVDSVNISVYNKGGEIKLEKQEAHGLAISEFIDVTIKPGDSFNTRDIVLSTASGTHTLIGTRWDGSNGTIHAKSIGSELTDCKLTWTCSDISKDIWVFGDSYVSLNAARFPYYVLQQGYDNWLICGASGASSQKEYDAFTKLLELGTPKYAVWCLGMNNPDGESINTSYKSYTEKFIQKCEENGIIPILSTIPSCWGSTSEDSNITVTRNNKLKTAWVKESGYRYIDFASAVENDNQSGWRDGMLSADGVHPTPIGAQALADQFIKDLPEIKS